MNSHGKSTRFLHINTHTHTPHKTRQASESIMDKRRPKTQQMRCKKHPKHRQSPGVCSICLGEKLSKLASTSSSRSKMKKVTSASSSSSSLSSLSSHDSSSNVSSNSSPVHHRNNYRMDSRGFLSFLKASGKNKNVLTKSRSMEFLPSRRDRETMDDGKKKGGFWSKIIPSRSKKMDHEGLMHSRTMKERFTARVH